MGRTEYTHLQYLYTTDITLLPLWTVESLEILKSVQYSYNFAPFMGRVGFTEIQFL